MRHITNPKTGDSTLHCPLYITPPCSGGYLPIQPCVKDACIKRCGWYIQCDQHKVSYSPDIP